MNASPRSWALTACLVCLAATASARAGGFISRDDFAPNTRHTRGECDAELRNARRFESLDGRGLAGYCESYRMGINQYLSATYYRPVAESAPVTGPLPQLRPLPPQDAMDSPAPLPPETPPVKP